MLHLGDIQKLNGAKIPKVDIITFGAPCQDISIAGKRAGMKSQLMGDEENTRSGLFYDAIRIIKEMREDDRANGRTDVDIRPRYAVYENVPGAFSSNKGEDFRCVLEETAKIADSNAIIPRLKTDKQGRQKWSKAGCIMGDGWSIAWRVHDAQFWGVPQRRKRISLVADFAGTTALEILFEPKSLYGNSTQSREEGQGATEYAKRSVGETSKCLNSWDVQSKHIQPENGIAEALYSGECRGGGGESYVMQDTVYCLQGNGIDRAEGGIYGGGSESLSVSSIVRRLTPMECERLQGFPDGWTDIGEWYDSKGKKHKDADSPRYKALGNSIALPFWQYLADKMVRYFNNATMGSLFDGIGGFPLVFSRAGATPIWASEVEEFPIAVTKLRFPEDE